MAEMRQARRARLKAMRRWVRVIRPRATFLTWRQVEHAAPSVAARFRELVAEAGYRPCDVLVYRDADGYSISFPPDVTGAAA